MRQILQDFWIGVLGAAFWLYSLAAQVSGYISLSTGLWVFALATALLVMGLWAHDPATAIGVGIVASLIPVWLGRGRIRQAWSKIPWRLRVPWERTQSAPVAPSKINMQPAAATAVAQLTREQENFRLSLRMFVTRLGAAYRALRLVVDRAMRVGSSHSELMFLAGQAIGFMRPRIEDLENMAQVDIARMDQNGLQVLAIEFQRHNYGETQAALRRLIEGLSRYKVAIAKSELDKGQELTRWLEAYAECLRHLRDLCTSPEVHAGMKREKYFATVDPNRWGGTGLA